MNYELILLAAGQGKRMLSTRNKILLDLSKKPIIAYSLETFLADSACHHIVLVVQAQEKTEMRAMIRNYFPDKEAIITIVVGGKERQDSVYQGLLAMKDETGFVLVHDGARPFITQQILTEISKRLLVNPAVVTAIPVKDTIKKVKNNQVVETVPRENLWQIQTPQGFIGSELKQAHKEAQQSRFLGTDDASLMEMFSQRTIEIVAGSEENIKLTTPADLIFGEAISYSRGQQESELTEHDSNRTRI